MPDPAPAPASRGGSGGLSTVPDPAPAPAGESSHDALAAAPVPRAHALDEEIERAKQRIQRAADRELERRTREILSGLLDVLDDLDRALDAGHQGRSDAALVEGVALVRRRFADQLAQHGVSPMPALGERFEPALHDAVGTVPVSSRDQDGVVVEVIRPGYRIGGEVLRPPRVIVGKLG